jgi:hypothetical protein
VLISQRSNFKVFSQSIRFRSGSSVDSTASASGYLSWAWATGNFVFKGFDLKGFDLRITYGIISLGANWDGTDAHLTWGDSSSQYPTRLCSGKERRKDRGEHVYRKFHAPSFELASDRNSGPSTQDPLFHSFGDLVHTPGFYPSFKSLRQAAAGAHPERVGHRYPPIS